MPTVFSLDELWATARDEGRRFDPAQIAAYPDPVKRYLNHAIAPGTVLASSVRLRMRGEIKLKRWHNFSAEEVISWETGMIWQAQVSMYGLPIRGSDRLLDGQGRMQWQLFGVLPFIDSGGADVTRSAAGRVNIESVWLPSVLCRDEVRWSAADATHTRAEFHAHEQNAALDLIVNESGGLHSFRMMRWGNPGGGEFRSAPFGGFVENEGQFSGYTVPTRMKIGWYPLASGFDNEGEFFRVTVDSVRYR